MIPQSPTHGDAIAEFYADGKVVEIGRATDEQIEIIAKMVAEGCSDSIIGVALGRNKNWVARWRWNSGIKRLRVDAYKPTDDAMITELFKEKLTDKQIGIALSRPPDSIRRRRALLNLVRSDADGEPHIDQLKDRRRRKRSHIACVMHLVDLKRAGHSPTRTEHIIAHDGTLPWRAPRPEPSSSMTSCAALCADIGGE